MIPESDVLIQHLDISQRKFHSQPYQMLELLLVDKKLIVCITLDHMSLYDCNQHLKTAAPRHESK